MREGSLTSRIDWLTILLYLILVTIGWFSIYAADYDPQTSLSIYNFSQNSGKQIVWIGSSITLILLVFAFDFKFFSSFSFIIYGLAILSLILVLIFGQEIAGSKSWFNIGPFRLQPSEFSKFATALAMAAFLSKSTSDISRLKDFVKASLIFLAPLVLIILQGDTGTALVFTSLFIVLFREGISPILIFAVVAGIVLFILTLLLNQLILMIGIIILALIILALLSKNIRNIGILIVTTIIVLVMVRSVDYIMTDVLRPHQQKRLLSLVNPNADPLGVGWNVTQSKIAIGSGGLLGKGFLNGTQTKFDFVPEQSTDFIFCTIGEEYGWIGSSLVLIVFMILLLRIVTIAERQKSSFTRIYAYGVASIIFFHMAINIAMTIGLFPVIGIPLPFISYGGSSLWSFTILLFVLVKLDAHRMQVLTR